MSPLILGLDLGTSSVKGILLSSDGVVAAQALEGLETAFPRPGHAEQSPDAWHLATTRVVQDLQRQVPTADDRVAAIGVCGAAHVPILLDEFQRPLRPAILWTDQRSAREAEELRARHGDELLRTALNGASPTWTLPQLMWLQRNEPDVHQNIRHLLIGKDAVVHRLTGRLVTDSGSAASSP